MKSMNKSEIASELRDRAEFLRGRVWVQHSPDHPGESCGVVDHDETRKGGVSYDAFCELNNYVVLTYRTIFTRWNDLYAADREEVCSVMEKAAAWVEEQL